MKTYAEKFYKSVNWQNCRNAYMKQARGLCEKCLERGLVVPAEEVHHKKHLTPKNIDDPNITLNFSNLIALCRECHRAEHNESQKRFSVDQWGRVSPREIPPKGIEKKGV